MRRFLLALFILAIIGVFPAWGQDETASELEAIHSENVGQMRRLARLGNGVATQIDWHSSGKVVAFGGGWGVWLMDESYQPVAHLTNIPATEDIAWSPTGNRLATLNDAVIRIWQVSDDFLSATFDLSLPITPKDPLAQPPQTRCLAWSDDGQTLGVGTQPPFFGDAPPRPEVSAFYDADTGTSRAVDNVSLERQLIARCRHGAISPDGQTMTYFGYGYQAGYHFVELNFVNGDELEPAAQTTLGLSEVYAMDWHPSGDYITLIHNYNILNLHWSDLKRSSYRFFNGFLSSVSWSPDGQYLLASSLHTPTAYLWKRQTNGIDLRQIPLALSGDNFDFGGAFWGENGGHSLMSGTAEYGYNRIDFIDLETGTVTRRIARVWDLANMSHEDSLHVAWNADYSRYALYDPETEAIIVASFPDGELGSAFWNSDLARYVIGEMSDGALLPEVRVPGTFPDLRGLSWDNNQLFIGIGKDSQSARTYRLDLNTGARVEVAKMAVVRPVTLERRDEQNTDLDILVSKYDLTIRNPVTGDVLSVNPDQPTPDTRFGEGGYPKFATSIHPDGHLVVVAVQGEIRFWSLDDGSFLGSLPTDSDIASLDWDPDGKLLAAGAMDGTLSLFGIPRSSAVIE